MTVAHPPLRNIHVYFVFVADKYCFFVHC
jgi:hypothetical protein